MLDLIRPEAIAHSDNGLRAQVGPFSLNIECAQRDADHIVEMESPEIYCQMELDAEEFHLVGFASENRRGLYKGLRAVSGIGRRSALVVLDCGESVDILRAVASKDKNFFRGVPGVGDKRISAIIATLEKRYKDALPVPVPVAIEDWVIARDSLMTHELSSEQADRWLHQVATRGMDAESLIEAATKHSAGVK